MSSDLEMMELQTSVLFRHDGNGRLLETNEANGSPAPRLFIGRTKEGNIWRFRHDLPDSLVNELTGLLSQEPAADVLDSQPPESLDRLRDALQAYSPVGNVRMGPAWRFPDEIPTPDSSPPLTRIDGSNIDLVRPYFPWIAQELESISPCFAVVRNGVAVSVCFCARINDKVAEAGVETAESFRRRGFATEVVSAWARAIRESGRAPLYSTSWDNLASRSVAKKLGLVLYGVDLSIP